VCGYFRYRAICTYFLHFPFLTVLIRVDDLDNLGTTWVFVSAVGCAVEGVEEIIVVTVSFHSLLRF
jgi:hypothetical protein